MKKLIICALLGILLLPVQSFASEKMGIYIAPKLSWMYASSDVDMYHEGEALGTGSASHSDNGFGGALAIGYDFSAKFNLNLRTELEYALYSKMKDKNTHSLVIGGVSEPQELSSEISISTLFVNIYYDFKNSSKFTPYIGAGLGIAFIGIEGNSQTVGNIYAEDVMKYGKNTDSNFAWNIGLGLAYDFNDRISLDLGYRYSNFGDVKSKYATENGVQDLAKIRVDSLDAHQIMLGVRFTF